MDTRILIVFQVGLGCLLFMSNMEASTVDFDTRLFVSHGFMLEGHPFWSSKAADIVECARLCLRRSQCGSFNYDTQTGHCGLNTQITSDALPLIVAKNAVYSEMSWWPNQVDPHCHGRPCQNDETCIPGGIAGGLGCSYICFKLYNRCPVPEGVATTETRTPNTSINITCSNGHKGGNQASCKDNLEWDKTLDTSCTLVYGSHCDNNPDCTAINGECNGNQCLCASGLYYRVSSARCQEDLYASICDINSDCTAINGECIRNRCLCGSGLDYNATTATCQEVMYASICDTNSDCTAINGECISNRCLCGSGFDYNATTATCQEDPVTPPQCPAGWILFENHCYFFGVDDKTYTNARNWCVQESSTLVQVDSVVENSFLKETMRIKPDPINGYWNDLYEVTTNGAERWRTTNDSLIASDWSDGNPDDTFGEIQRCTMFYRSADYSWIDIECEERSYRLGRALCKKLLI